MEHKQERATDQDKKQGSGLVLNSKQQGYFIDNPPEYRENKKYKRDSNP
jgi:hypothetical protein